MWLGPKYGYLQDWITQVWVKATGRRIEAGKHAWLMGPAGDTNRINDSYISRLCADENLVRQDNIPGSGLLDEISEWALHPTEQARLHPAIIDFYTHTYDYSFSLSSRWMGIFYPFGWLLSIIFSRRLQQLNLPLRPSDTASGVESSLIKLFTQHTAKARYTIWHRTLQGKGSVVFSGIYGYTFVENENKTCLKIIFPLPNGNATVILGIKVDEKGNLCLTSKGKSFGDPGFYFLLKDGAKNWGRYVKSMHEQLDVFVDENGLLKAQHVFRFYGLPFMRLGYSMERK